MKLALSAALVALVTACGGESASEPSSEAKAPQSSSPLTRAAALARADRRLSQALARRQPFVASGDGFETAPHAPPAAAFVRLEPARGFALSLSRRNRAVARLLVPGDVTLDEGVLTSNDSLWLQSGDTLEQLLWNESGAPLELDWRLELEPPIVGARRERGGALLLTDAHDRGVLRVAVPYALDAAGEKLVGALDFTLEREPRLSLSVRFSVPGSARPPVLVDPALSAVLWQERATEAQPLTRVQAPAVYHPGLRAVLVHGGNNEDATGDEVLGDLWAYDGEWTQLAPLSGGPARYSHGLAYTASPESLLLFGGRDENRQLSGVTFRWEQGAWTEVSTTGPAPRDELGMTHVPSLSGGDVLLFAGADGRSFLNDTWLWDGTAWSELPNAGGPGGFGQSLVFDAARARALVFGGAESASIQLSTLALFDGARWRDTPDPRAPARASAAMAFDQHRKRAVLFGGQEGDSFYDETWEWDSETARWSPRPTDVAPPPLAYASMAYDPERRRTVLFGGWLPSFDPLGQTWEYRVLGGSCETADECEGVPCVDGACCRQAACGTCQACSTETGECEPITNRADPDRCSGASTCDRHGECKLARASACELDQECESGVCADGVCCDRACTGACEACDLEGSVGTCRYVKGAARHGQCDGDARCSGECEGDSPSCAVTDAGVTCGAVCDEGVRTLSACDGGGACVAGPSAECPHGFACDSGGACLETCTSDDDCRGGLACRDAACVPRAAYCSDRSTLRERDGTERSCAPFACRAGECLESCERAAHCAEGFVCDEDDECIAPPSAAREGEGCGCRVAGRRTTGPAGLSSFGLLVFARWRRRLRSERSRRAAEPPRRRRSR